MQEDHETRPLEKSWDNVGKSLFVPEHFEFTKTDELFHFIDANPMGHIICAPEEGIQITNAPMIWPVDDASDTRILLGHIASRNSQAKTIENNGEAVILFHLPGNYISARWFKESTAPTWSYISVQARGRFTPLYEECEKLDVLRRTVAHMEARRPIDENGPWDLSALTPEQMQRYYGMITVFRFEIQSLEGIRRLNQEKTVSDMQNIAKNLEKASCEASSEIAAAMKSDLERSGA